MELSELNDLTLQLLRERWERLKQGEMSDAQFRQDLNSTNMTHDIARKAYELGVWRPLQEPLQGFSPSVSNQFFDEHDADVRSILWRLVGLGILIPCNIGGLDGQFFELSAYGKQVLEETIETPYDPLGFIRRLKMDAPNLEQDTIEFVGEAVDCFLGRHFRAAAVMVGLASEKEILALIDLYKDTLDSTARASFVQGDRRNRNLRDKFDHLFGRLSQEKDDLPLEVRELDVWLQGTFQVIRLHRNDAGHPTGHNPGRETVYANLNLFLTYARHLSTLKHHLKSKSQSAT